ncbi:hypothetical protein [Myroides phaeus]|uniref:Lipoprotein n=1 Tax=Myroides phaeus TaxID=702745 RepID=A0A1G8F9E3_9FLAO|nr:hypothetical protein [Myroides phaeus]MEC4116850.1 hypothetical protein [Myroides phaeus]SDH78756.1 hypothetical protein SAMN05421818_11532 [Myroides phaeus]
MKSSFYLLMLTFSGLLLQSCQTTETIVSAPYKLNKSETTVYSAKTFMFKNYFFTYKDGEATLVYQQDDKLNKKSEPIFLKLQENNSNGRYQEFIDSSKQISVKIINQYEVRLQLDKARYTLYTSNHLKEVNADTDKILADMAIWKNVRF